MKTNSSLEDELKTLHQYGVKEIWRKDELRGIQIFKEAREKANKAGWTNDALIFTASILLCQKKFREVIDLLTPKLTKPSLHLLGYAYVVLGNAYELLGEFSQALDYYNRALEHPGFEKQAYVLNYIGLTYRKMGKLETAIEYHHKALEDSSNDVPAYACNNLGIAYGENHQYEKAIEFFLKAIEYPEYENHGTAWLNLGLTYRDMGDFEEAIKWLRKSRDWHEDKEPPFALFLEDQIRELKRKAKEQKERENITQATDKEDPILRIFKILDKKDTAIQTYFTRPSSSDANVLAVLKGWSSSIPTIALTSREEFSNQECNGGGYFVKTVESGYVVDPGFDFTKNFSNAKFHIREVTDVIISHYHIDHYEDFNRLIDLEYQLRRNLPLGTAEKKDRIRFHMDKQTYNSLHNQIEKDAIANQIPPNQKKYSIDEITLDLFKTKHSGLSTPMGFVITLPVTRTKKIRIGYTSDTSFFPELPNNMKKCDIIIAHFSSADEEDFKRKKYHDKHLGYRGLFELIEQTDSPLYIISEFWGGIGDYRIELGQKLLFDLAKEGNRKELPTIIPGDVGCLVKFEESTIYCSCCENFVPYTDITVAKPERSFGRLRYLCKNCILQ